MRIIRTSCNTGRAIARLPRWTGLAYSLVALSASLVSGYAASPASAASSCQPTAKLVNPCRPWLGAFGHGYSQVPGDLRSQIAYHEQRVGRRGDIVRGNYHVGAQYLTPAEKSYARRPSTILLSNWKPSVNWAAAGGADQSVNRVIDSMAGSIRSAAPHKIMLVIAHEPENDVSSGTSCTTKSTTGSGSPADYRAMWANVQRRFAARGVKNVVWVMNYMGYKPYDCLVPELWPGNSRVDWVVMDSYGTSANPLFDDSVGRFYRFLASASDASHNFLSKPWGLGEFSIHGVTQMQAYAYWNSVRAAVHNGTYPKLKAYIPFDSTGGHADNRVAYGVNGALDPLEQASYNAFAHDPAFGSGGASPDTIRPRLSRHSISPRAFRVDRGGRGALLRFSVSEPAHVVVRIGRKDGGGVRPVGRFTVRAGKGMNATRFSGRIGGKPLAPGRYRATLVARDGAGNTSPPRRLAFRVVGG